MKNSSLCEVAHFIPTPQTRGTEAIANPCLRILRKKAPKWNWLFSNAKKKNNQPHTKSTTSLNIFGLTIKTSWEEDNFSLTVTKTLNCHSLPSANKGRELSQHGQMMPGRAVNHSSVRCPVGILHYCLEDEWWGSRTGEKVSPCFCSPWPPYIHIVAGHCAMKLSSFSFRYFDAWQKTSNPQPS